MIKLIPHARTKDCWGEGYYGANRGDRLHSGKDVAALPGNCVLAPISGRITKIGYPYSDDLSFRYVQISDTFGNEIRVFYCYPTVKLGDVVTKDNSIIGVVQDTGKRYKGITPHLHIEVKKNGDFVDPDSFFGV